MPDTGTAAACSKLRLAGLGAKRSALAQAYSAQEPSHVPYTGSPGLNCRTFFPTASTVPAASMPRMRILGLRKPKPMKRTRYGRPVIRCQTPGSTPAASTRTRMSSSPAVGFSMSRSSSTSAEPYLS
jgi:hypothetical protein